MNDVPPPRWATEHFWKKTAIWVTAGSFLLLILLTFDTLSQVAAGGSRVPAYSVINQTIDYRYDESSHRYRPIIGGESPLFGQPLNETEAENLVALGKKNRAGQKLRQLPYPAGQRSLLRAGSHQGLA